MPSSAFTQIVHTAADKTFWLDKEKQIKSYCDSGWSAYLIDHDPENLVLPLLREGRSTSTAAASTT
jgi:hypothetical protein